MSGDITSIVPGSVGSIGIVLILVGLVVAFFGKTLFKLVVFLIGALAGGALAGMLANYFFSSSVLCLGGAVVIGAIIGGYLALTIVKGILAIAVGGIFAWLGAAAGLPVLGLLVLFIAGFVIALVLMDKLLAVITGITGGAMFGVGIMSFMSGTTGSAIGLVAAVVVAFAGIYYQFKKHNGDMSRPDKDAAAKK